MISNLTIQGFRAFREMRVDPLARVNLFVGPNNAGKTTILEAVELLVSGSPESLLSILGRRREEMLNEGENGADLDPSHLFCGHAPALGSSFHIEQDGEIRRWIECTLDNVPASASHRLGQIMEFAGIKEFRALVFSNSWSIPVNLPLSREGGLSGSLIEQIPFPGSSSVVKFVGTEPPDLYLLGQLWDDVVLTPEENGIVEAMRLIESAVERIAFVGENRRDARKAFIRLTGSTPRLPLGTVGDGLKHLVSLSLHLLSAKGGYLLVDEIDTGLHHTVMSNMWKLVIETAERLDIQVFATTHSWDCVEALAWIHERHPELAQEVRLHRIDSRSPATIVYTMDEIAIAARDRIEVR
jgi:energy-coupling factor transporter ATP-binding protein EcfA2